MSKVISNLWKRLSDRPQVDTPADNPADSSAAPLDAAEPHEPEAPTDIRRSSRMTSAMDLQRGLEVSEPMPLDTLPDDLLEQFGSASGAEAPTIRLRRPKPPTDPA